MFLGTARSTDSQISSMVGRFRETPGIAIDNVGKSFWLNVRKETAASRVGEASRGRSAAAILIVRCRSN